MTLLLAASGQLHINMPFLHWLTSEFYKVPLLPSPSGPLSFTFTSPEAQGANQLTCSDPTPRTPLSFPSMFLCFSVDSLALLINYWVHLAIMLRRTVRLKRDCVAHLVCTPCWSCSVFLRRGCEIVHVLIILFYKGIKGAAGRVGPYFHSCSCSGVYSHTGVFLVLLWICSIIKIVKRLL